MIVEAVVWATAAIAVTVTAAIETSALLGVAAVSYIIIIDHGVIGGGGGGGG